MRTPVLVGVLGFTTNQGIQDGGQRESYHHDGLAGVAAVLFPLGREIELASEGKLKKSSPGMSKKLRRSGEG